MKKILIVEDHADIRRLIRMTLEFEPCEIREASDAQAGWQQALHFKPDLALMDVMMPGDQSGLDLCQAIKLEPALAHTRVIILSARGNSVDREAGLRAGADEYLVKPFSPMQLLAMVERGGAAA